MNLEDRLRRRLGRVEPGDDFADRVLARLDANSKPDAPVARATRPVQRWAIAASVLLMVGAGVLLQQQRVETARREAAGRQLVYALDLTSRELQSVHRHLSPTEENGT